MRGLQQVSKYHAVCIPNDVSGITENRNWTIGYSQQFISLAKTWTRILVGHRQQLNQVTESKTLQSFEPVAILLTPYINITHTRTTLHAAVYSRVYIFFPICVLNFRDNPRVKFSRDTELKKWSLVFRKREREKKQQPSQQTTEIMQ